MDEAIAESGTTLAFQRRRAPVVRALDFARRWPIFSVAVFGILAFGAIFGPLIIPYEYDVARPRDRLIPPVGFGGSWAHPLGTDQLGRDMVIRLVAGSRISLMVVAVSVIFGTVVGVTLGLVTGYYGGVLDEVIMRLVDIWYGIPFLMVAMMVVVVAGQSLGTMVVLLALASFAGFVRVVRAEVLSIKERDYVALARVAGASTPRMLIRHILPGVFSTVLVVATLQTGGLILAEAFLSFIGAGIPPPSPAWGLMVAHGRDYLQAAWWAATLPGIAILITVMALNFFGDWLRDKLDPRLRQIA